MKLVAAGFVIFKVLKWIFSSWWPHSESPSVSLSVHILLNTRSYRHTCRQLIIHVRQSFKWVTNLTFQVYMKTWQIQAPTLDTSASYLCVGVNGVAELKEHKLNLFEAVSVSCRRAVFSAASCFVLLKAEVSGEMSQTLFSPTTLPDFNERVGDRSERRVGSLVADGRRADDLNPFTELRHEWRQAHTQHTIQYLQKHQRTAVKWEVFFPPFILSHPLFYKHSLLGTCRLLQRKNLCTLFSIS